jgi:subtilisin-like proprotein convertase family protein
MKKNLYLCGVLLMACAGSSRAAIVLNNNWTVNQAITEGSPVGITESETLATGGTISDVSVNLDISGGYNGYLYGYLTFQSANGQAYTEILLNEIGTSSANPFGSSGAGLNVTLSDSGTVNGSIHNAAGVPTGTWLADSTSTLDGTFGGLTADGTWTLYLADLSVGGGTSTLDSWGLEVSVVPEPAEAGLVLGAGALLIVAGESFRRGRRIASRNA